MDAKGEAIRKTSEVFASGMELIGMLDESKYKAVGGHFRHNLDFVQAFLHGLERGLIDYSQRERDLRVEVDPRYAVEQFICAICRLADISKEALAGEVMVASEIETGVKHYSSVAREVEFLYGHTLHHHALIAEKLSHAGVTVPADFGVAPSTLEFWASRKAA